MRRRVAGRSILLVTALRDVWNLLDTRGGVWAISVFLLVALFLGGPYVRAQYQRGSIYGAVKDSGGAFVPNVKVTLTSPALLAAQTVTTDNSGVYRFPTLPPGGYILTAELTGFSTFVQRGIQLATASDIRIDIVLHVAQVASTVTVNSDAAPTIDLESNTITMAYNEQKLANLPNARDIWSVAESMPGVVTRTLNVGGSGANNRGNQVYAYGSMGGENTYFLNGVIMTDPVAASGGESYTPYNEDSFSEMSIETGAKSPEIGGGGVYISMTSQSGGNMFSGGGSFLGGPVFSNNIDQKLLQRGVTSSNAMIKNVDYSARIGGPIIKDRLWFFLDGRIRQIQAAVLNFTYPDGSPAPAIEKPSSYSAKFTATLPFHSSGQFYYDIADRISPDRGASPTTDIQATNEESIKGSIYIGTFTKPFGNRAILDVRGGHFFENYYMGDTQWTDPNAIRRVELTTNNSSLAPGQDRHHFRSRLRLDSALTYYIHKAWGSHQIRGGLQYENGGQAVDLTVHSDEWLEYENGVPNEVELYNSPSHYVDKYRSMALHINDTWNPSPRVTVNAGLRFSLETPYWPAQNNHQLYETEPWPPHIGQWFPTEVDLPAYNNILDWHNLAPRLGISVDPLNNTRSVIRFTYGRYYTVLNSKYGDAINPDIARFSTFTWTDLNGDGLPELNELGPGVLSFGNNSGTGAIGEQLNTKANQPYEDQYAWAYDWQMHGTFSAGVSYQYRRGENGMGISNELVSFSAYTPLAVANPIGLGNFNLLNLPKSLQGVSEQYLTNQKDLYRRYNGGEFRLARQFANRWQLQGAISIGKELDLATDNFSSQNLDPNLLTNAYGADVYDSKVIVRTSGSYQFPWNIVASGNYRYTTGTPFVETVRVTGLNQGPVTIDASVPGTIRYPSQSILDLRFEKRIMLGRNAFAVDANVYNLFNSNVIITENPLTGSLNALTGVFAKSATDQQIQSVMPPRTAIFGVKYNFNVFPR